MVAELGSVVLENETHEQSPETVQSWRRVVRSLHRLRRLQRYWGLLGGVLRAIPASLRDRLRIVDGEPRRDTTGLR